MPTYEVTVIPAPTRRAVIYELPTETDLRTMLKNRGLTAPAADDMAIADVIEQVNEVNGGEVWITTVDA